MRLLKPFSFCILLFTVFLMPAISIAQCMFQPIPLRQKITAAEIAVIGKVIAQHSYVDKNGNIYTLNKIDISAWLKNQRANVREVYVITEGGEFEGKLQITTPAVQLQPGQQYFLMLEKDNRTKDDKNFRSTNPSKIQALVYADAQGALLLQDGSYHDITDNAKFSEEALLQKIYSYTKQTAKTSDGSVYRAKTQADLTGNVVAANPIVSLSPNPAPAGTIKSTDFLTITGSGFGTTVGTVSFKNADDGGATYITPPNASDYVKWKDDTIVVKIPSNAGTGRIKVNTYTSPDILTITYAHIAINSSFSGFASSTRQRYYLRKKNVSGGYTFKFNTPSGFNASTAAKNSFKRAITTWRCNTQINWEATGTTKLGYASDGVNSVLYDSTLPAGVLARATSRFGGGSTGSCNLFNTVWYLDEIDVQFQKVPLSGYTWQYGPASPTGTQFDFESVALHELGHAHGLGHRISGADVMNYSISNGVRKRVPAAAEIDGGVAKMAYSTIVTCFNPTGSGSKMLYDTTCTGKFAASENVESADQSLTNNRWYVYPNPVTSLLYIRSAETTEIRLINNTGAAVKQVILKPGLNKIDVSNISSGIYFIQSGNAAQRAKITIMH